MKMTNLSGNPDLVKDITTKYTSNFSNHQFVRCKEGLNLRREKEKLMSKKHPNTLAGREKAEKFSLNIQT